MNLGLVSVVYVFCGNDHKGNNSDKGNNEDNGDVNKDIVLLCKT